MRPIARVVGVVASVVAAGCQTSNAAAGTGSGGVTDAQRAAITDTATAIVNGMITAASNRNGTDFVARFAKDSVMIVDNGQVSTSATAYGAGADSMYANLTSLESKSSAIHVQVLSPDAAFTTGTFTFNLTAKSGKSVKGTGVITALLQRRGGTWTVTDYHESEPDVASLMAAIVPPPPPKK